jgi:hypothetical protein
MIVGNVILTALSLPLKLSGLLHSPSIADYSLQQALFEPIQV